MPGRLEGRVAIVTGSDSGMGQAMADVFSREGADCTIIYFHDKDGAENTKRTVESNGSRALLVQADLRNPGEVEKVFDATHDTLGIPYILVNDAGIDSTGDQVADMSLEDWENEMRTNLFNPFYCCRLFIRDRRKAGGGGKIINITSIHQSVPRAGAAGYDVAKAGVWNLTRTLALELAGDRITVNNVAPGMVLTPFNQKAVEDPEYRKKQVESIPLKRAARPEEVARLVVYLASDDADYVTGATFVIDGGLQLQTGQGA